MLDSWKRKTRDMGRRNRGLIWSKESQECKDRCAGGSAQSSERLVNDMAATPTAAEAPGERVANNDKSTEGRANVQALPSSRGILGSP